MKPSNPNFFRLVVILLAGITGGVAQTLPPDGTFFTPVNEPTRMYFKPPPEAPRLPQPINPGLTLIAPNEYHEFFIIDGKVSAIGGNRSGMMGLGNADPSPHPRPVHAHTAASARPAPCHDYVGYHPTQPIGKQQSRTRPTHLMG